MFSRGKQEKEINYASWESFKEGNTGRAESVLKDEWQCQHAKGYEIFHWRKQHAKQCGIGGELYTVQYVCSMGVCGDTAGDRGQARRKITEGRMCQAEISGLYRYSGGNY